MLQLLGANIDSPVMEQLIKSGDIADLPGIYKNFDGDLKGNDELDEHGRVHVAPGHSGSEESYFRMMF